MTKDVRFFVRVGVHVGVRVCVCVHSLSSDHGTHKAEISPNTKVTHLDGFWESWASP